MYTRLAGRIELFYNGVIDETVYLRNDAGSKTAAGVLGFFLNQTYEVISQTHRRQREVMKFLRPGIAGEKVKKLG